jgi:hypothetical protein
MSESNSFMHLLISKHSLFSCSFDLELPLECDDEYLEMENPKQPSGIPSKLSFFIWHCRLMEIAGFAQRALVSK